MANELLAEPGKLEEALKDVLCVASTKKESYLETKTDIFRKDLKTIRLYQKEYAFF